ncbi:hypothetical protein EDB84DRAFT_1438050 [Lactarius hengduanensis]|nr:hypothetical protein EDB84DRAFT_1438050 [Lactarius hengduanensis]
MNDLDENLNLAEAQSVAWEIKLNQPRLTVATQFFFATPLKSAAALRLLLHAPTGVLPGHTSHCHAVGMSFGPVHLHPHPVTACKSCHDAARKTNHDTSLPRAGPRPDTANGTPQRIKNHGRRRRCNIATTMMAATRDGSRPAAACTMLRAMARSVCFPPSPPAWDDDDGDNDGDNDKDSEDEAARTTNGDGGAMMVRKRWRVGRDSGRGLLFDLRLLIPRLIFVLSLVEPAQERVQVENKPDNKVNKLQLSQVQSEA